MNFDDLKTKYPHLIKSNFRFGCGDGWVGVLDRYFAEVDALLPEGVEWKIDEIDEKYGSLRMDCAPVWSGMKLSESDAGGDRKKEIQNGLELAEYRAEGRSSFTCEKCRKPGSLRRDGEWMFAACDDHAKGIEAFNENAVWQVGDKKYRFDVGLDDLVEIDWEPDDE